MRSKVPSAKNRIFEFGMKIKVKWISFIAICLLGLSLIPVLLLSFYNFPSADDYAYPASAKLAYEQTGSLSSAIEQAVNTTATTWRNWQGTFSSIFFMSLAPHIFNADLYKIVTFLMVFTFLFGCFVLCRSVLGRIFGATLWEWILVACWLVFFGIHTIPSPVEAFYWYNGSVHYIMPFSISLLMFSLVLCFDSKNSMKLQVLHVIISCLLAFYCGGTNYVTALNTLVGLILFVIVWALRKKTEWRQILFPLFFQAIAFIINVVAPGNSVRQVHFEQFSVPRTIIESFRQLVIFVAQRTTFSLIVALLILAPFLWNMARRTKVRFQFPFLVTLVSICYLATCFSPALYSMQSAGVGRIFNVYYLTYLLLLVFNIFYYLGWLAQQLEAFQNQDGMRLNEVCAKYMRKFFLPAMAFLMGFYFIISFSTGTYQITAYHAALSLVSGEAEFYANEQSERMAVYEDESITEVAFEPLQARPYLLFFDDITTDPTDWRNTAVSNYYRKEQVYLLP